MVKKKSKPVKRKFAAKKAPVVIEDKKGFFARFKDIIPEKKETVRVKTFIVEKPVYVSAPQERVYHPPQKYVMDEADQRRFDSRQSRYSKRNQRNQEIEASQKDELDEGQMSEEESADFANEEAQVGDDFDENGEQEVTDEEGTIDEGEELPTSTHIRSRGMVKNIWWRKALFWAILVWLIILAISMAMQALKLIEVDLTRQWWMLLAGIIVIALVYFKFFEGKI